MDVSFETSDGRIYPLDEQAALVAENLRLFAIGKFPRDVELVEQMGASPDWRDGAKPLSDVIEAALVGGHDGPVPVEGKAAEALYWALVLVTNAARDLSDLRIGLGVLLGHPPADRRA
jgi:hypothetical protein